MKVRVPPIKVQVKDDADYEWLEKDTTNVRDKCWSDWAATLANEVKISHTGNVMMAWIETVFTTDKTAVCSCWGGVSNLRGFCLKFLLIYLIFWQIVWGG